MVGGVGVVGLLVGVVVMLRWRRGMTMVNVVPSPRALLALMVACEALAISRQKARPMPVPGAVDVCRLW